MTTPKKTTTRTKKSSTAKDSEQPVQEATQDVEVIKPLTETQAMAKYHSLKLEIEQKKEQVEQIEVKDDPSYNILKQNVTTLSKTIKAIDAKRLEVNRPFQDRIDFNNEVAKRIKSDAEDIIAGAKTKLLDYDAERNRKLEEAQRKIDQENAHQQELLEAETARKNKILTRIANLVTDAQQAINEALDTGERSTALKMLTAAKDKYYSYPKAMHEQFEEFQDELNQALETIMTIGKKASDDVRSGKFDKVQADESFKESLEAAKEAIEEENYEKSAEIISSSMQSVSTTHNQVAYRKTWEFEIPELTEILPNGIVALKIPAAFITVNKPAVDAWIANLKRTEDAALKEGNIVYGIKFILKKTPVLR